MSARCAGCTTAHARGKGRSTLASVTPTGRNACSTKVFRSLRWPDRRAARRDQPGRQVDGETWRRLKVTFPDHIKSHTREQISCFGPDGLLRRQDYTVDILDGAPGLNYAADYRDVDGIIIPATRRIYAREGHYQLVPEPLLVAIDMAEITIR